MSERFDIPGVSIVQRVDLQASQVGYLKTTESVYMGDWLESTGNMITGIGTNMIEIINYSDTSGETQVAGFSRIEQSAVQTEMVKTFIDKIREITLNLKGMLWKKNVSPDTDLAYMEGFAPHPTGIQPLDTGKYNIGKTLMPIPAEKWGLVYVDLLNQTVSS